MIYLILVFQLILNVVTTNSVYSIELIKFSNLETIINDGLMMQLVSLEDVINFEFSGINENQFENMIKEIVNINLTNIETILSFHFYNYDQTFCSTNECDSVQFKIENNNPIIKLEYEYAYSVIING
jgi:hypothetical protein